MLKFNLKISNIIKMFGTWSWYLHLIISSVIVCIIASIINTVVSKAMMIVINNYISKKAMGIVDNITNASSTEGLDDMFKAIFNTILNPTHADSGNNVNSDKSPVENLSELPFRELKINFPNPDIPKDDESKIDDAISRIKMD